MPANISAFPDSHLAHHYKLLQGTEAKANVSKLICSSETFFLYLSNNFFYPSPDFFLTPESVFYEGELFTK